MRSYSIKRFLAAIVDYGVFHLFLFAYVFMVGVRNPDGTYETTGIGPIFVIVLVWLVYFPLIESWLGYTLGKGLFDLKVIDPNGKKASLSRSLKRHLLDSIDVVFFSIAVFVPRKTDEPPRRLGDLWAGTRVVSEDFKAPLDLTTIESE